MKEDIGTTKRNLKIFQPNSPQTSNMGNPKDKEQNSNGAMGNSSADTTHDACQASQDQSRERAMAIDKLVAEAIARESAWLTVTFTAILKESNAANMPTSLKVTSRAAGIKAMPPLTGPRTRLSTRDGIYGLKRLDTPLIAWKEIQ